MKEKANAIQTSKILVEFNESCVKSSAKTKRDFGNRVRSSDGCLGLGLPKVPVFSRESVWRDQIIQNGKRGENGSFPWNVKRMNDGAALLQQ
ncbi:hypothetical protein AAC387_Pa01g0168 [Persea americana]